MLSDHVTVLNTEDCDRAAIVFHIWLELIRHATSSNRGILSPRFDTRAFDLSNLCDIVALRLKTVYTAVEVPSSLAYPKQCSTTSCIFSLSVGITCGISNGHVRLFPYLSH